MPCHRTGHPGDHDVEDELPVLETEHDDGDQQDDDSGAPRDMSSRFRRSDSIAIITATPMAKPTAVNPEARSMLGCLDRRLEGFADRVVRL